MDHAGAAATGAPNILSPVRPPARLPAVGQLGGGRQ